MYTLVLQTFDDTNSMPLSKILGRRFRSQSVTTKVDIRTGRGGNMGNIACSYMNHSSIGMILKNKDKIMRHVKSSNANAVCLVFWTFLICE